MEEMALKCCEIISAVGTARSCYIEAIHKAKDGDYDEAKKLIEEGKKYFIEGHEKHLDFLQQEAEGNLTVGLILLHAEDQLMSAESFGILAVEFISVYQCIKNKGVL